MVAEEGWLLEILKPLSNNRFAKTLIGVSFSKTLSQEMRILSNQ